MYLLIFINLDVNNDAQKVSCQEMYYCIDSSSQMRMKFLRTFLSTHSHRRFQVNEHQSFDLQTVLFSPRFNGGHGFNHNDNFQMLKARINHWLTTTCKLISFKFHSFIFLNHISITD